MLRTENPLGLELVSAVIASAVRATTSIPTTGPASPNSSNPPSNAGTTEKEALSVQTTTLNFKNFVEKSGPIFWFQDTVEDIVQWKDPLRTAFWGGVWACLCLQPVLLVILPNLIIIAILISTYPSHTNDKESIPTIHQVDAQHDPLPANEPSETSVDYLSNMQNIQIMMGRVSQGSDAIKTQLIPYLNWTTPSYSLALLHLALLTSLLLLFISPYIPWSYVFLLAGESVLLAQHPVIQTILIHMPQLPTKKLVARLDRVIDNDALSDHVLDSIDITSVVCLEHQRYGGTGSGWSETFLDQGKSSSDPRPWTQQLPGHVLSPTSGLWAIQPPEGYFWIPSESWYIDHDDSVFGVVDEEGWRFVDVDVSGPSLRRRKWLRRAYKPAKKE